MPTGIGLGRLGGSRTLGRSVASGNLRYRNFAENTLARFGANVVSYLPLWETAGPTATDISGNGINGTYGGSPGVTFGQAGIGDGRTSVLFPGEEAWVNWFSTGLRDAFNGSEGALIAWAYFDPVVWTDGAPRYLFRLTVDSNNYVLIRKDTINYRLYFEYRAGGSPVRQIANIVANYTGWKRIGISWSSENDRVRAWVDGQQLGADQTAIGTWAGSLATAVIGAYIAFHSGPWYGRVQHPILLDREPTPEEMAADYYDSVDTVTAPSASGFSVVFWPDTQAAAQTYPGVMLMQAQWIADNKDALNIKAVIHEGDVVETAGTVAQWQWADAAVDILDEAGVPYLIGIGQHDYDDFPATTTPTAFNTYFPQSRYTAKDWWAGGFYEAGHSENAYNIVTIGAITYIFITVETEPSAAVLTWLDGLLTTHADKTAILHTHVYLGLDGQRDATGAAVWEIIKQHDNVIWVACGHYVEIPGSGYGASRLTSVSDGGKDVHQVLANYQSMIYGGNGWLRVVKFEPTAGRIDVQTYSPVTRRLWVDGNNDFTLDYP